MNESLPPVHLPPAAKPSKLPIWVIMLIVGIVFCCCSIGVAGLLFAFGEDILYELGLYTLLPVLGLIP